MSHSSTELSYSLPRFKHIVSNPQLKSFNFVQASDGVSFNIYTDGSEAYFAEFDASNPPNIYIQQKDTDHPTPRYWSVNKLSNGTYTIGPIGGSPNVWTAPTKDGQLYLADDTKNPPTVKQQFTIS
ncbi:hypothetical protein SCLCIDRAFT_28576 [Scleroderma citrinum Foug A]|uniref:Uncharacterized protein n=1 Tax=Scleroderma citrinum Foug A TaxID=1036808 RepID=A0A0C3DNN1_9AGAM|nr:hypothetical protein SCLCIDRAFT_28576 [Scleroderma citrinum Foug A]